MKLISLIKKVLVKFRLNTIYKHKLIYPNWYLFNITLQEIKKSKRVLFYFNSSQYMHLGDHLFFVPIIKLLYDNGFDITISPNKIMVDFFSELGYNGIIQEQINQNKYYQYDVIVSRIELLDVFKHNKSILIDVAKNLTNPICNELIASFSKYFQLRDSVYKKIDYISIFGKYKNDIYRYNLGNKKLILFNLYCDSSKYLITKEKKQILLNKIKQYANLNEYQLVFVGSSQDKLLDRYIYDFNFIDLRGLTSVLDIFKLVAYQNTMYYIGFDAFIMHVFSLYHKSSFVVFRGRISQTQNTMLRKYHVNLFDNDDYVKLLN